MKYTLMLSLMIHFETSHKLRRVVQHHTVYKTAHLHALSVKYQFFICSLASYIIYTADGRQFTDFSNIIVPHTYFNVTMTAFHGVLGDTGLTLWSWIMWDVKGGILFFILANIGATAGSLLIRCEVPLTKTHLTNFSLFPDCLHIGVKSN